MYLAKSPKWLRTFYKDCVWQMSEHEQKIYLTFDDGPHPEITTFVLAELKKYQAKATFFCIGNNIAKYPQVLEEIKKQGHAIGNHTYNHLNGWEVSNYDYMKDITYAAQKIESNLFRPPYGRIRKKQIDLLKTDMKIVMWSVLSGDFDVKLSKENCLNNVLKHTHNGSIVVFHDSEKAYERLAFVLPKVLEYYSEKGYAFEALSL